MVLFAHFQNSKKVLSPRRRQQRSCGCFVPNVWDLPLALVKQSVDSYKGSIYNIRTAPSSTEHYTRAVRGSNATTAMKHNRHILGFKLNCRFWDLFFLLVVAREPIIIIFREECNNSKMSPFLLLESALFGVINNIPKLCENGVFCDLLRCENRNCACVSLKLYGILWISSVLRCRLLYLF